MNDPLRSLPLYGDEIGLDNADNLLVKGKSILLDYTGTKTPYPSGPASSITYDGSNRVATYVKNGQTYTCAYYTSGNGNGQLQTIIGGGQTRTFTYNAGGLLITEVVT